MAETPRQVEMPESPSNRGFLMEKFRNSVVGRVFAATILSGAALVSCMEEQKQQLSCSVETVVDNGIGLIIEGIERPTTVISIVYILKNGQKKPVLLASPFVLQPPQDALIVEDRFPGQTEALTLELEGGQSLDIRVRNETPLLFQRFEEILIRKPF